MNCGTSCEHLLIQEMKTHADAEHITTHGDTVTVHGTNGETMSASGVAVAAMAIGRFAHIYGGCSVGLGSDNLWRVAFANVPSNMAYADECLPCAIVGALRTVERLRSTGMITHERE